jgi:hypothetical protein
VQDHRDFRVVAGVEGSGAHGQPGVERTLAPRALSPR